MTHETQIYMDEINRLKERVNTLIDILDKAAMDEYDPQEWLEYYGADEKTLDKELPNRYTVS